MSGEITCKSIAGGTDTLYELTWYGLPVQLREYGSRGDRWYAVQRVGDLDCRTMHLGFVYSLTAQSMAAAIHAALRGAVSSMARAAAQVEQIEHLFSDRGWQTHGVPCEVKVEHDALDGRVLCQVLVHTEAPTYECMACISLDEANVASLWHHLLADSRNTTPSVPATIYMHADTKALEERGCDAAAESEGVK